MLYYWLFWHYLRRVGQRPEAQAAVLHHADALGPAGHGAVVGYQGAGDSHPLLLAAGQLPGHVPQPVAEADGLEGDRGPGRP